ncbi:GNAT family N-acetyltransferase [Amycolatopsis nigrescens]|uniref:GNAT family N-acetyltransferase n=1 Tax=Amycolatopsis nigrescens TaxID=381445 RepID=UPI00037B45F4|nr:GNAT family N-acetyltransferase [Amycolatopsis nigrescens]
MTFVIESDRLDLVPLTPELLRLTRDADLAGLGSALGTAVPEHWPCTVPAQRRLAQLAADPAELPWLARAIVLREPRTLVGMIGFHAPPDERASVEVGYEILPEHRRRGYAREAVVALEDWAFRTGAARIAVAATSPENLASRALIESLGFRRVGEQIDEEDGLELVFERELPL